MELSGWRLLKIPDLGFFNIKELFGRFQILKSLAVAFSMQENVSPNVLLDIAFSSLKFVAKFSKQEK